MALAVALNCSNQSILNLSPGGVGLDKLFKMYSIMCAHSMSEYLVPVDLSHTYCL